MTDNPKAKWPKTPGGTIDWDVVFEDPQSGLISLILQAQSASALRECTIAVIKQLYTRKDDPPEVERFSKQIAAMIPDGLPDEHLPKIAEAVTGILRQIKDERIRKAHEYELEKAEAHARGQVLALQRAMVQGISSGTEGGDAGAASSASAGNRRSAKKQTTLTKLALTPEQRRRRKIIWLVGIVTVIILGAVGGVVAIYMAGEPQREAERKANLLIEQITAVSKGETLGTHVYGGAIRVETIGDYPAVIVEGLTPEQCASTSWVFANKGNVMINNFMPTRISPSTLANLCTSNPDGATLAYIPRPEKGKGSKSKKGKDGKDAKDAKDGGH